MKTELHFEGAKALPAVAGAGYSILTLNEAVALATLVYVCMQITYLTWKWVKEARKP